MADGTGYGVGLFDSQGPEKFAASIGKITTALTGVSSAFSTFGGSANKSLTSLGSLVDSLTKKLQSLSSAMSSANVGGGGGAAGGGGPSSGGGGYTGGSGGTGVAGAGKGLWVPRGTAGGDAGPATGGAQGNQTVPTGTASAAGSQLVDQWNKFTEGTADDAKALAGNKMTNAGNGGTNNSGINVGTAATSLGAAAVGGLGKVLGGSLMSQAVQGQWIGASIGSLYGATGAQQRSQYVIPKGTFAQSAGDYAQANQYMQMYMGASTLAGQGSIAGQNAATFNRGAQQLMTLNPTMTRQQAMVTQNQMNQPGTLNAGLMFGMNFQPGGKAMSPQQKFDMIMQKMFAGFPGGKPTGEQFSSYMTPGGPGENNLRAMGIEPGSDEYASFMTYAQGKIGLQNQGKKMPSDIGTKAGAKAFGGVAGTAAFSQLQAQSAKSQLESRAEPGMADAAKNLNNAAATLLKAVGPLGSLFGGGIGKLLGGPGILGGITSHIPGASLGIGLAGKIPGVGGIIKSIFQQGGEVPGTGPQLAVVHGGEFVLTKDDVDKMRGKKGGHGGGNGAGLSVGRGGKGGGDKSISNLLTLKPTDNEVSTTVLGMLFSTPPAGSLIGGMMKAGGAQHGAGKTAAPAQGGGKGNAGVIAVGGMDRVMQSLGIQAGTPAAANLTALLGGGLGGGTAAAPAATGAGGVTGAASTTSPWNYKQVGGGSTDLSSMFASKTTTTDAATQTSDTSGTGAGASGGTGGSPPVAVPAGGDYTPTTWAQQLLKSLGAPVTDANVKSLVTWENREGGHWHNPDKYNPLNTTQDAPGAVSTNAPGVKAYTSWQQGLQATIQTLKNGLYDDIVAGFMSGQGLSHGSYASLGKWSGGAYTSLARGTQQVARSQLALLHRGEAVVPAADNYSSSPYNKGGAQGNTPIVQLNFKPGSVVLQVPAGASQTDMQNLAQQFVAAISKPQALASVRST